MSDTLHYEFHKGLDSILLCLIGTWSSCSAHGWLTGGYWKTYTKFGCNDLLLFLLSWSLESVSVFSGEELEDKVEVLQLQLLQKNGRFESPETRGRTDEVQLIDYGVGPRRTCVTMRRQAASKMWLKFREKLCIFVFYKSSKYIALKIKNLLII